MGLEAECRVEWASEDGHGRAQLETDALRFKGAFRLSIPIRKINNVVARGGTLEVTFGRERAVFHLGNAATRWAERILHPPSLLDKLGVKADMSVAVVGRDVDAAGGASPRRAHHAWLAELGTRTNRIATGRPRADTEMAFLFALSPSDLSRLKTLRAAIRSDGAIWVIWPKGRPELKEDHVRDAARAIGLVDVKVASVSEQLSGLKLMIPRALREAGGKKAPAKSSRSARRP
jgi:hypothetical protein